MNDWYANLLLDSRWLQKRRDQLAIDKYQCISCHQHMRQTTLVVHHIGYVTGWMPWDYPHELLQTLCIHCHAAQHAGIKPIYALCHICGVLTPEELINGRDEKHQWICESCIIKSSCDDA